MTRTVGDWLRGEARREPPSAWFEDADGGCSGAELRERVFGLAGAMRSAGVRPGDRVAVLLPRGLDEGVSILAAMAAGAVEVPLHNRLKQSQVEHVIRDAAPRLCVVSSERLLGLAAADEVLDGVERIGADARAAASSPVQAPPTVGGHDPAVILYTSGSTGRAKGIVQTHANLIAGAERVRDYLELVPGDRLLSLLSFSFDYGLNQLLSALATGCSLAVADHLGVGELATLLRRHRPTGLAGVPSFWHDVAVALQAGTLTNEDGDSLRFVTNSGGRLPPEDSAVLRARWPETDVFAMYGLTEAFRSAFLPPAQFDDAPDSFGYAIEGVELLLVDVDSGAVLEGPGQGELVHAGALVARGYWRQPEATAARFRCDPRGGDARVVYSGDLVRRDEQGRHFFVARLDGMMKVQGHRVSPDEVSREVAGAAGVGRVAVFGAPGGAAGDRVVLFAEGDPDDLDVESSVRRRCRARLPSYMQPAVVKVVRRLPHNANGKIDEAALRGML